MGLELRILILQNSKEDSQLIERELRNGGLSFNALVVETEEAYVRGIEDFQPHLILADYELPSFDGMTALSIAREKCPHIPFICVSGNIGEDLAIETLKQGTIDYVLKDRLSRLVPVVKRALKEVEVRVLQAQAEQALGESEKQFRATFELAAVGVANLAPDGRYLRVNQQLCETLGYSREEMLQRKFQDFTHPDDLEACLESVGRLLAGEIDSYTTEKRYLRKDGSVVWGNIAVALSRDDDGQPKFLISVIEDITERKTDREKLRESEEHYRTLFDNMLNGFAYCRMLFERDRPKDFIYLSVNRSFETLTGLKDVIGKKVSEVIPGIRESDSELFEIYGRVAITGIPERFETYVEALGMWFSISVYSPRKEHFVVVFDVITERKQAEKALKESRQELVNIIDFLPDATIVINNEGEVISWNKSMEEMTGVKASNMLGKGNYEYALPFYGERRPILVDLVLKPQEEILSKYTSTARRDDGIVGEAYMPALKNGPIYLFATASILRDSTGNIVGAIESIRDITERKRMEEKFREQVSFLETLFDTIPNPIFYKDANGRYIGCNQAFLEFTGKPMEEILGKTVYDMAPKDIADKYEKKDRELFEHRGNQHYDWQIENRPGEVRQVIFNKATLADAHGALSGLIGVISDITERKQVEEALRASEERFRYLFEQSRDGIVVLDQNGKVCEANQRYAEMLGYSAEEISHFHVWDWDVKWTQEELLERMQLADSGGDIFETRHRRKDGTIYDVEISHNGVELAGQKVVYCVCRDISQRKATEQAVRVSEERLRLALTASQMGVLEWDLTANTVFCSTECYNIFGFKGFDGSLEYVTKIVHPEDRDRVWMRIKEALEKRTIFKDEFRIIQPDGNVRWVMGLGQAEYNADGQPLRLVSNTQDITERKQTESERERLIRAIEQITEAVAITDHKGTIQYVNPAFVAMTGYTPKQAIGQNCRILKSGRQDEGFYRNLWETISIGRTWTGRMVNKRKNGSLYTEESTISPVLDFSGKIVNYVAVKRDITEHLRLSDHLVHAQKMESVGQLAGGVAHDFNNMLGIILGYAEIALDEVGLLSPFNEYLTGIRKAARRSADITQQLLAFASKQTINPHAIDLNQTIEYMLKMLQRLIGENVDIAWLPEVDLHPVKMDPVQIDQILANLVVNARDAIKGVGTVTIKTENVVCDAAYCAAQRGLAPGEYVMLSVSDKGCGMDKKTQSRIFDPFFTTKVFGKGTGLGLATVYGIVKQNGGFINVYSEPGRGTTFKIYIPRHAAGIAEAMAPSAAELPKNHCETVLLVEDEPELLKMGKRMLEKLGYNVLTADTPCKALCLVGEHAGKIHLLLTDVVMPEINGWDLAEQLLAKKPGMNCLFMSGYTADVIANHGVLKENMQFIQKPFSIQELAAKVREALGE
jgi:PAS domain S-box-containing protein